MKGNTKYDFNDILIVPQKQTKIYSRYKDISFDGHLPLLTAPMDTVIDEKNYQDFLDNGIGVVFPRTIKIDGLIQTIENTDVFFSLGLEDVNKKNISNTLKMFPQNAKILIDIANGHMDIIIKVAKDIKKRRSDIKLMVGNIANPDTYFEMAKSEVIDYVRVGIGNGSGCLTTKQSGVGYPMASLINEIKQKKTIYEKTNPNSQAPYIVADGGMKEYSDIIKALALGADYVMLGSILNKSLESCANNYLYGIRVGSKFAKFLFKHNFPIKKYFRGMSTKEVQKEMGKSNLRTSEGVVRFRKVEYTLYGWVENFTHYLRNAMSYTNCRKIENFIGNPNIIRISNKAYERFDK